LELRNYFGTLFDEDFAHVFEDRVRNLSIEEINTFFENVLSALKLRLRELSLVLTLYKVDEELSISREILPFTEIYHLLICPDNLVGLELEFYLVFVKSEIDISPNSYLN
jgi:hypothetical protein